MSDKPETVRERIEDVRKRIPPREGRRAQHDYIAKDDFVELVGASRSRVYAWTREDNPSYPEPKWRERLAELSQGRYVSDDFARPGSGGESLARRVAALERTVERLERHIFGRDASQAR